jgi:protein arginine kinase activator
MLDVTCQLCAKRPATTHLTELDPGTGQRQELHLCATCIQRLELKLEAGPPPIAEILDMKSDDGGSGSGKIKINLNPAAAVATASEEERCPECGLAFSEFGSGKLFGCSHDYTAFADKVETLLRNYHGTSQHRGRHPIEVMPVAAGVELRARRAQLDAALREAVAGEKYEDAARLRDELRKLERPSL